MKASDPCGATGVRVGLDFGGVIVPLARPDPREDTALGPAEELAQPRVGAVEGARRIVVACGGRVWIVSRAGRRMRERTRAWLLGTGFHERTGLAPEHVIFCARREDKVGICRDLRLDHFVDDRVHLMQLLRGVVPHLHLFGEPGGERFCPPWARFTASWHELAGRIVGDSKPGGLEG